MMKNNMGGLDRIIRILVAIIAAGLYITGTVSGILGIVLIIAGGIFALTSFISFCPIYAIFGLNTCAVKPNSDSKS